MNTTDRPTNRNDDFEVTLRNGLDRLAADTQTSTPGDFDPDALPITSLTMTEPRRWTPYLVTTAAATIAVVGLTTLQRNGATPDERTAATQPVTTSPTAPPTDVSETAGPNTSAVSSPDAVVPAGTVVCIDAGGGQQAAGRCEDELGGVHIDAGAWSDESFLMTVNPTDTGSVNATLAAAQAINSPIRDLDPQLLPAGFTPPADATTYYVLGARNPYTASAPSCSTGSDVTVPNVAGQPYTEAVNALVNLALTPNPTRELPPPEITATPADYSVIRQNAVPGTSITCGTVIDITVAYRPGILYVIQAGDTWASVANAQGIPLDELLSFSGLTIAELESSDQSPDTPLPLGQALPLSAHPATVNTLPTSTSP